MSASHSFPAWATLSSLLVWLLAACSPQQATQERLWVDEEEWQRIELGWARAVSLDRSRLIPDVSRGERLEAVIFVSETGGELVVESGGRESRVPVRGSQRIEVKLSPGHAKVHYEGSPAVMHGARRVRGEPVTRREMLVLVDTLRADYATAERMPEVVGFFAPGALFRRAYSPATWTPPSVASLFTGKVPVKLRVADADGSLIALPPRQDTLAKAMGRRGFHSVAIIGNYVINHENGFSAGFDLFLAPEVLDAGEWPDAELIADRARQVLSWLGDRDLFVYLHFSDPHDPYRNHEAGSALAAPTTGEEPGPTPSELAALKEAYGSEVRRLDGVLGTLLRDAEPLDVVAFTSDHGEEFLEHGGFKHGPTVYPEVSRVPLMVRGGAVEAGSFDDPISLVELKGMLTEPPGASSTSAHGVGIESFTHGVPPRWSWAHEAGQVFLFAQELGGRRDQNGDAVATWLERNHPAVVYTAADGEARFGGPGELQQAMLRLGEHFWGYRRGMWIFQPEPGELLLEVGGVEQAGWVWGPEAATSVVANGEGGVLLSREQGPSLIFLAGSEASSQVVDLAMAEPILLRKGPPRELPSPARLIAWADPGRDSAEIAGVSETMERLRVLGYLDTQGAQDRETAKKERRP